MKKATVTLAIMAAFLTGCATSGQAMQERRDYVSWVAFCANRGYNINDNTGEALTEYIGTWCGSAEESQALINAGLKPN